MLTQLQPNRGADAAMQTIAVLELEVYGILQRLNGLAELGGQDGFRLQAWAPPYSAESLSAFLDSAAGLLIPTWTMLKGDDNRQCVLSAILSGKRAVVLVDPNEHQEMNDFLDAFGVEVTALRPTDGNSEPASWLKVRRATAPAAFRDSALFDGVQEVTLGFPYHILVSADAETVFALPIRGGALLDTSTDFFVPTNLGTVSCVVRAVHPRGGAGVLVSSAMFLWDRKVAGNSDRRLVDENTIFVRNVLKWLSGAKD